MEFLSQLGILVAKPRIGYIYNDSLTGLSVYKNLIDLSVKDYQSVPAIISEETTAYEAIVALFMHNVGSLCVVDSLGVLVGLVSRKDLLKMTLSGTDAKALPVSVVMTRMPNLIMTSPDESLWTAAKKLILHEVDSLPITKQNAKGDYEVLGRFTKTNVAKAFVDLGYGDLENRYQTNE